MSHKEGVKMKIEFCCEIMKELYTYGKVATSEGAPTFYDYDAKFCPYCGKPIEIIDAFKVVD